MADQLRRAGWAASLLVVLPLVAGGVAFAVNHDQPTQWESTASILTSPAVTTRTAAQYVNDLHASFTSDNILRRVAQETGVSYDDVSAGLVAPAVTSGGSLVTVTFTSTVKDRAAAVPSVAARLALQSLIRPQVDSGESEVALAKAANVAATKARDDYTTGLGVPLPGQVYQTLLAQIGNLRNGYELARAEARFSTKTIADALVRLQTQATDLAPRVVVYDQLQGDVDRTYVELNRVRTGLAAAQAQLDAVGKSDSVAPGVVSEVDTQSGLVRSVVSAALAGLLIAALLVLALPALFARRRRSAPAAQVIRPDELPAQDDPVGQSDQGVLSSRS